MARFPEIVNQENFNDALSFVKTSDISFKRKNLIKKISKPISFLIFWLMSLIILYGAMYTFSDPEEMFVFEKFGILTDSWNTFSGIFTNPDMPHTVFWPVLVLVAYLIPVIFTAIIAIIVTLCYKGKTADIADGDEKAKAKALHKYAENVYSIASNFDYGSLELFLEFAFTIPAAVFCGYAIYLMDMLTVSAIVGLVVSTVVVFFLYKLLLAILRLLTCLFYKKKRFYYVTTKTDAYWLSVDPEEAKRREEEAEKKKAASKPSSAGSSHGTPVVSDSFTWTYSFVRDHETECSNHLLSVLDSSKKLLAGEYYTSASCGFEEIVHGLEHLINIDKDYYVSPLFANCYALSRIYAFGVGDKENARKFIEKACDYAAQCKTDSARRDLIKLKEFRDALRTSQSLSSIAYDFKLEFPEDILSSN